VLTLKLSRPMKKLILIVSICLAFMACDGFFYMPPDDINDDFTNPVDTTILPPEAEVISGPSDGEVITETNSVTFVWKGVYNESEFQYMLEDLEADWNGPFPDLTASYNDLANGDYAFKVLEHDPYGNIQESPTTVNFTIDFATSVITELIFSENNVSVSAGSNPDFTVDVLVKNITNLMGAKIKIQFDPTYLSVLDASKGNLFGAGSDNVFWFDVDNTYGDLVIETSVLNLSTGVDGSGKLAVIQFRAKQSGTTLIEINPEETVLRDHNNNDLSLENYGSASVNIN